MTRAAEAGRRLEEAFGFTADELAANERGELSERQRGLAQAHSSRSSRWTAVAAAMTVGTLAVVGPLVLVAAGDDVPTAAFVGYGVVCLVVVCIFAVAVLVGRRRSRRLAHGDFLSISGSASSKVKRTTGQYGGVEFYVVKIGSKRLRLANGQQLSAFDNGSRYAVHYFDAPGAPIVLSCRPI